MTENRKAMDRKLKAGTAVDISKCRREDPYYILDEVIKGKDYFDSEREVWVWSIGRRCADGVILASMRFDLCRNPDFDCLWIR